MIANSAITLSFSDIVAVTGPSPSARAGAAGSALTTRSTAFASARTSARVIVTPSVANATPAAAGWL